MHPVSGRHAKSLRYAIPSRYRIFRPFRVPFCFYFFITRPRRDLETKGIEGIFRSRNAQSRYAKIIINSLSRLGGNPWGIAPRTVDENRLELDSEER